MGTETKINSYTSGINRVPKVIKHSSGSDLNKSYNNGKCSSTNLLTTSVTNSPSAHHPQSSSSSQTAVNNKETVPFVPIEIDENAVIEGAEEILKVIRPTWDLNFVQFKVFLNKRSKIYYQNNHINFGI